jgi:hypothetical protein
VNIAITTSFRELLDKLKIEILKCRKRGMCMKKEVVETKVMQTIGVYTIVKSVEQTYWDNGKRFGRANIWYDICLDGGDGDIVASYDKLNDARRWAKEN